MNKKSSLFTVRKKKKERHPQVVVDANRTSFSTMGITHSSKKSKRNNYPLKFNPNKNDVRKAYLKRQVIKDFKFNFSKAFKNYALSNEDIEDLKRYLDTKKKK